MSRLFKYAIIALIVVLTVAAMARADILLNRRQHAVGCDPGHTWVGYDFVDTVGANGNVVVPIPSVSSGDMLVVVGFVNDTNNTFTPASGFTTAYDAEYINVSYKIASGSEGSTVTVNWTSTGITYVEFISFAVTGPTSISVGTDSGLNNSRSHDIPGMTGSCGVLIATASQQYDTTTTTTITGMTKFVETTGRPTGVGYYDLDWNGTSIGTQTITWGTTGKGTGLSINLY